jgi:hypothetical protein
MISPEVMASRIASFPENYIDDFNSVWKLKVETETNKSSHILDENNRKKFYRFLCTILPRWQTYRNGGNSDPLGTLKNSLANISDAYNQIRKFTLLEFDSVPREPLEIIWHELGRVKEFQGRRKESGFYYVISVSKPLMLIWGQTMAFDSKVRDNLPRRYDTKGSRNWTLNNWIRRMEILSEDLKNNTKLIEFIDKESARRYGEETIVPYGRFLDIYYFMGPEESN